jgi:hypothetical protein
VALLDNIFRQRFVHSGNWRFPMLAGDPKKGTKLMNVSSFSLRSFFLTNSSHSQPEYFGVRKQFRSYLQTQMSGEGNRRTQQAPNFDIGLRPFQKSKFYFLLTKDSRFSIQILSPSDSTATVAVAGR